MRALILAAGFGERLRPLTLLKAKPAIEFLNIPMLGYPYYWLNTLGLADIVFNTHYLPDSVRTAALHVIGPEVNVHFSHEPNILGSGGGLAQARTYLEADPHFAVANADAVVTFDQAETLKEMYAAHVRENVLATLLLCPLEGLGTRIPGVWVDKQNRVVNFGLAPAMPGLHVFHFASIMFLSQKIWPLLPSGSSNILYDVLQPAIARGERVEGFVVDSMSWFETGESGSYLRSTQTCLNLIRRQTPRGRNLEKLLQQHAPPWNDKTDFAQLRLIDNRAEVDSTARLSGFVVLGQGARIGPQSRVESTVVLPGHVVPAQSEIKDVVI